MPYKSQAQAGYFHTHKAELERQGVNVDEWDAASKGMKLPDRAKSKDRLVKALEKKVSSPVIVGSILIGADEMVAELVRSRIPHLRDRSFGPCTALGVIRRGVLVGGVVFNNYRGFDVHVTGAFDRPGWALPGTLRALFAYPFLELGCRRVTVVTGKKNKKARKLCEELGFVLEGVLKRGLDGFEDAFVFGMLKENCHWLKDRNHGFKHTASPAAA